MADKERGVGETVKNGREKGPDVIGSEDILAGRRAVTIRHGDETYVLRLTKLGKLILTK